jgi:hypothetical protein
MVVYKGITKMNDDKTGGPAFPLSTVDALERTVVTCDGMTIRDYFAAKALTGILSGDHPITHELDAYAVVTKVAYEFADAMLEARK